MSRISIYRSIEAEGRGEVVPNAPTHPHCPPWWVKPRGHAGSSSVKHVHTLLVHAPEMARTPHGPRPENDSRQGPKKVQPWPRRRFVTMDVHGCGWMTNTTYCRHDPSMGARYRLARTLSSWSGSDDLAFIGAPQAVECKGSAYVGGCSSGSIFLSVQKESECSMRACECRRLRSDKVAQRRTPPACIREGTVQLT